MPLPQAMPQPPQLRASLWVLEHTPLQNVVPVPQAWQCDATHTWLAGHVVPHVPQFVRSVVGSVQTPPQVVPRPPAALVQRHAPATHDSPVPHA